MKGVFRFAVLQGCHAIIFHGLLFVASVHVIVDDIVNPMASSRQSTFDETLHQSITQLNLHTRPHLCTPTALSTILSHTTINRNINMSTGAGDQAAHASAGKEVCHRTKASIDDITKAPSFPTQWTSPTRHHAQSLPSTTLSSLSPTSRPQSLGTRNSSA